MKRALRSIARFVLLLALPLAAQACTPSSFQPQFKTPVAPTEQIVLRGLALSKPRQEQAVLVGVSEDPMRLFAYDLERGAILWEQAVVLRSAPLVVADAIVAQEADGVVVRELATGTRRVLVDDAGQLVGADGRGHTLVISIAYPDSSPRGAIACVDGSRVRWKRVLALPVGVPALADDYALVPWATQRLSVLSVDDGTELARWNFTHTVIGHALIEHGHAYAGQQGLLAIDAQTIARAAEAEALYTPQKRSLPGQPPLLRDGYLPVDEPDNAIHRLQLSWRPAQGPDGLHAENDQLLLRFYRLLFALDARKDELQWVRTFEHDLVGVAIQPGGSLVADSAGVLRVLDPQGRTLSSRELGRALRVATIRPGAWFPATQADASAAQAPAAEASASAAPEAPAASLYEQLFGAAALPDSRLSAGRAYAIEQLGKLSEPGITGKLIALCDDAKSPEPVQHAACDQLAQRKDGQPEVLAALGRHASFVRDQSTPPIAALAPVAARMELQQAAPLLLSHLQDPATPASALAPVIVALEQLGYNAAAAPLDRFVRLHHDEPEGSEFAPAVDAALHALGALHVRAMRASLQAVANDGLAPAGTRMHANEALALLDAPPINAKAVAPKPEPEPVAVAPVVDTRPYSLGTELVRSALADVKKPLSQCVSDDPSRPRIGRVSMVVNGRGEVEGVFVTPTSLQACVEPVLRKAKLPETRLGRQRVTYEIRGANASANKPANKTDKKPSGPAAKRAKPAVTQPAPATRP